MKPRGKPSAMVLRATWNSSGGIRRHPKRVGSDFVNPAKAAIANVDLGGWMSTQSALRVKCVEIIDTLHIPQPFRLIDLLDQVARRRAKRIELMPSYWGSAAPCGVLVSTDQVDYVCFDAHTSDVHQIQIVFHELGHMMLGHTDRGHNTERGNSPSEQLPADDVLLQRLMPNLSPALIRRLLGRSVYDNEQEQAAELFASILMGRVAHSSLRKEVQVAPALRRLTALLGSR
jgi:hypothetical protein